MLPLNHAKIQLIAILYTIITVATKGNENTVTISSSCNGKSDDGLYYIKPTADGAVIPVICSDGYTMLDASLNYDSLSTYFTTLYKYGDADKTIYGTDCSDSSGWRDWYTPANEDTKFRIARNCESCTPGAVYGDNTAYYMTSGYFCPVEVDRDGCSSEKQMMGQTQPDIMCNICDDEDGLCGEGAGRTGDSIYDTTSDPSWCDCYTLQLTPDHLTTASHDEYCQGNINWRPNLVIDRSQCTCYQPLDEEVTVYDDVQIADLPTVSLDYREEIEASTLYIDDLIQWEEDSDDTTSKKACVHKEPIYLTQKDFLYGTYRITECGHYVVSEDIAVNFNAPSKAFEYQSGDSPNTYNLDNLYWFPTNEQQESGEYFGLNAFWGPYSIGFMAAITIETDHVWLDLNGHSIAMEYEFYLQQRFFAIIELGNKQFEARQGPVDFGRDDLCSKDIEIKDGTLGLSSHHGIHGSCVKYVEISNLKIQNFDVTGIQCNGCKNMNIADCVIGPQNTDIPVKGRYTHARIMLSRLRYLVDEYGSEPIRFANRKESTTVQQLANTLIEQMDMVYYHVMHGVQFDENDEQWQTAKRTFLNPTGWMDGGSSYGILLNGYGTAVVNIGRRTTGTFNINIKNVEIHDIKVKPHEGFWASTPNDNGGVSYAIVHGFFFETIDWNYGNVYDHDTGFYLGDAYTDILFAANTFLQDDFCPLGSLFYLEGLSDWVFNDGTDLYSPDVGIRFSCGSDIQSHSAKGAMGIRIDGVEDFSVEDVYIHDIANWGDLGSDHCGEYENVVFEEGVNVDKDIQYGYTGHKVHGILTDYASGSIKNIKIEKLDSWHGSANSIALYKGTIASLSGYIEIDYVVAGSKLTEDDALQLILPNPVPFVCSVLIGPNSDADIFPELSPDIDVTDDLSVSSRNMYGYDYCEDASRVGVMTVVSSPEVLNVNIVNGESLFSFQSKHSPQVILTAVSLFVVAMIILFKRAICNHDTSHQTLKGVSMAPQYGAIE